MKFGIRDVRVMLLRIRDFRENRRVCACHEALWSFEREERLCKICILREGRKRLRSSLKKVLPNGGYGVIL